jgi:hypothetical protein
MRRPAGGAWHVRVMAAACSIQPISFKKCFNCGSPDHSVKECPQVRG